VGRTIVDDALNGFNSTVIAYGQTGSGKTYTMHGPQNLLLRKGALHEEVGIVLRVATEIFEKTKPTTNAATGKEYQVSMQMVEIYKEALIDLLLPLAPLTGDHILDEPIIARNNLLVKQNDLRLKESPRNGTYVHGLTKASDIKTQDELLEVLVRGESNRHVNSTRQNKVSSRSHSICMIQVQEISSGLSGVINLVDLAGSERVSKSCAEGEALEEAKKINQSLSALGNVINCIVRGSGHIPFRDSKLTRLLKESFAGNNKTTLIVNCSTHRSQVEETLSTLRFARRAKLIQNKVKANCWSTSGADHKKSKSVLSEQNNYLIGMVQGLKDELNETKRQLKIVRDVRADRPSTGQYPEDELESPPSLLQLRAPPQIHKDSDLIALPISSFRDLGDQQSKCPTCGSTVLSRSKPEQAKQFRERQPSDGEGSRGGSMVGKGGHQKFMNKLRHQLDQERLKNQDLSRRIRHLVAKNNEQSRLGRSSTRQYDLNAELKKDLGRLHQDLEDILEQLELLKCEETQ